MVFIVDKLILQMTGQPGSGKSESCRFLSEQYAFETVVVSDLIRDYATQRGLELARRKDYKPAHAQMIAELGEYAIVDSIVSSPSDLICVDGIRVPAHSIKLRNNFDSKIFALHCPSGVRFVRNQVRNRATEEGLSYAEFLAEERQENRSNDPFVQVTLTVMEMADFNIDSSGTKEEMLRDIATCVEPLLATA